MIYSYDKKKNLDPEKEDFRTSTIIGMLLYLPDSELWKILREACFNSSLLPADAGKLKGYDFWPHWDSENTDNTDYVEPDSILEFDNLNIIIEAKRYDEAGQDSHEWRNELIAYQNEYRNTEKEVFLIALGGNANEKETVEIEANGKTLPVVRCSWIQLQRTIIKRADETDGNIRRVLDALLLACDCFGFRDYRWLEERPWVSEYTIDDIEMKDFIWK